MHLFLTLKCSQKMRKNQSKQDFKDFLEIWRKLNFAKFLFLKCFFFPKILCRSSTKRHWIIKDDLKHWSYTYVCYCQKRLFHFFLIFRNSKLLPITHSSQQYTSCRSPSLRQSNPLCRHILVYATFDSIFLPTTYSNTHAPKLS